MKKVWLIIILAVSSIFLGGCSLSAKRSAIEIDSYPVAKVFLDGEEMGLTPYRNKNLLPGEIEVRLESNGKNWTRKIKLQNNISTVIDWEFGENDNGNGGYILYLEKTGDKNKAGLLTNTTPNKSTITIDNEIKGMSPLKITNIGQGDKHITLSYPGHKTIDIFAKSLKGYQLVIEAILSEETVATIENGNEEIKNPDLVSTITQKMGKIKETETGWLRVREKDSSVSKEIARINPGETYPVIEETTDWYRIDLGNNKSGWVSSSYVEKIEQGE
jgi:hypothetical protein